MTQQMLSTLQHHRNGSSRLRRWRFTDGIKRRTLFANRAQWGLILPGIIVFSLAVSIAQADFNELLSFAPQDSNALVMVNTRGIFDSPYGQKHQLANRYAERFAELPLAMPPDASHFVLAAEFDMEFMEPQWEAAVAKMTRWPTIEQLASKHGGTVETIRGKKACRLPDAYIVRFTDDVYGMMWPARRQRMSRWVQAVGNAQQTSVQEHLERSTPSLEASAPDIVLALDLFDVIGRQSIREALGRSSVPGIDDQRAEQLASTISTMLDIRLEVRFTDVLAGRIVVDFKQDKTGLEGIAKPLLLQSLENAGALLPEFRDWREEIDDHQIAISGEMSPQGVRQIVSLLALDASVLQSEQAESPSIVASPPTRPATLPARSTTTATPATRTGPGFNQRIMQRETIRYVDSITQLVNDLQEGRSGSSVNSYAMYLDRYARKIDRMFVNYVEPDVAALGKQVASKMNSMVSEFHDARDRSARRQSQVVPDVTVRTGAIPYRGVSTPFGRYYRYAPFSWSQVNVGATVREKKEISSQEIDYANEKAQQYMSEINQLVSQMNKLIQKKYDLDPR